MIEAVIFDFDATLTQPHTIDFAEIKRSIGCPSASTVLDFISTLSDEADRAGAYGILVEHERVAAETAQPGDGAEELVLKLREQGYRVGVLTRNSTESVHRSLKNFKRLTADHFDAIVSRDDPVATKPDPESVRYTADLIGAAPDRVLVVGDHRHDIDAGRDAGSWTCLLLHDYRPEWADSVVANYEVLSLTRILRIVEDHRPLPLGKLPNELLAELLAGISSTAGRPDVIVGAAVGRDFAAVDVGDQSTVVAKADPITFTTAAPGRYAVTVNANDMVCSGAEPRWFLCTALLPAGTTPFDVRSILADLDQTCRKLGAALVGGHTELTDAVRRPVLSGMMLGTVTRDALIVDPATTVPKQHSAVNSAADERRRALQIGDRLLMTKSAAIEGSIILATEQRQTLLERGVSAQVLDEIASWEDRLSVVPEARLAWRHDAVRLLHDVTEGGMAGAVRELAAAADARLAVNPKLIPIAPPTETVCRALTCNPLGLIGSGSLLIIVGAAGSDALRNELRGVGIEATDIGQVVETGNPGICGGLPEFTGDELTRC